MCTLKSCLCLPHTLTLFLLAAAVAHGFTGSGTEGDPYLIETIDDMDQLAADVNGGELYDGKFFRLANNLDYTDVTKDKAGNNYTPVGLFYSDGITDKPFKGFFDGDDYTIKGIRVSYRNDISGGTNGVGIFGFIYNGSVKNLTVEDCVFKGTTVGGVVGYNYGATIKNTHVKSSVIISSDESSTANHGGIAGRNHLGTVEGNISEAQVTCNEGQSCSIFGGIVGHAINSTTKNNLYLGTKVEGSSYVGLIAGKIESNIPLDGNIYPGSLVGGGAGRENESTGLDIAGAAKPRSISLQGNISLVPGEPEVSYSNGLKVYSWGLKYDGVTYYKPNGTISLAYNGNTFISGFQCSGSDGCEVSGSTLTIGFDIDELITEVSTVASTGSANDPYLIMSANDWDHLVQMVNQGETFSGKFFKLTNNISDTTMVGSDSTTKFFAGTFDGAGNTITVTYGSSDRRLRQPFMAPFRFVNSGTIKNLHTAGSIYIGATTGAYRHAGGIAGRVVGNSLIDSCHSSVTIDTDGNGDRSHGGLVGIIKNGATTISNSYFSGKLLGPYVPGLGGVHGIGGLVGWVESRNDAGPATLTLTNCLFKPAQVNLATAENDFATLARTSGSNLIITNCYYTQALGTVQGTKVSKSVSTNDLDTIVTAADGEVYYIPTNATISGISNTYNQGTSTADVVPVVTIGGQTLTNEVDYAFSITKDGNPVGETLNEAGEYTLTVQGEGTTYVGTISTTFQVARILQGEGSAENPYIIANEFDWETLAQQVANGETFKGKFLKMTADIYVTKMIGSDTTAHYFAGTFDGNGHTLKDTLGTINNPLQENNVGPFRYIDGATIKGLRVIGEVRVYAINDKGTHASGLVGYAKGNSLITNNRISATIVGGSYDDYVSGEHAGLVGAVGANASLTIKDCLFDGELLKHGISSISNNAGFIGKVSDNATQVTIENCLFNPKNVTLSSDYSSTFARGPATITNSYYKSTVFGTDQGIDGRDINVYSLETLLGYAWDIFYENGDPKAVPNPNVYETRYGAIAVVEADDNTTAYINGLYNGEDAINISSSIQVDTVVFNRTFSTAGYSTIMLPFTIDTGKVDGLVHAYEFHAMGYDENNKKQVQMAEVGKLYANTPYIIEVNDETLVFHGGVNIEKTKEIAVTSGAWEFRGTLQKKVWSEGDTDLGHVYGYSAEATDKVTIGQFVKAAAGAWIRPLRAYLILNTGKSASKSAVGGSSLAELPETMDVVVVSQGSNGEVSKKVIGTVDTRTGEFRMDRWYDMQGRKLNGKPTSKGTYYHNGKAVTIR